MTTHVPSFPRLPSPPPLTENQIAPPPTIPLPDPTALSKPAVSPAAAGATRRIRPGTKSRYVTTGAPLTALSDLDSAFQLQEHLASLICSITNPPGATRTFPLTRSDCERLATPPEGIEDSLWCYELTRRLTRDLNMLIVALLQDHCTAQSCPEMRASEWQYLCAVHDTPQSCCAIDYSTHTLDHAATMLTSNKYFPSRLTLHPASVKHLASIFRRLYRIFAHAWFQHRHVFWEVEGEHGLYLFFKTVSDRYNLIPQDNLMMPLEAEGVVEKNGDLAGAEDSEEEDFDEWDRGTSSRGHAERGQPGGDSDDDDDDDDDDYSDESESDDEIVDIEEEDDIIEGPADKEYEEPVDQYVEEDGEANPAIPTVEISPPIEDKELEAPVPEPAQAAAVSAVDDKEKPVEDVVVDLDRKDASNLDDVDLVQIALETESSETHDNGSPTATPAADTPEEEKKD